MWLPMTIQLIVHGPIYLKCPLGLILSISWVCGSILGITSVNVQKKRMFGKKGKRKVTEGGRTDERSIHKQTNGEKQT